MYHDCRFDYTFRRIAQVASTGVNLITASLANGQNAACWLVVSKNGKYAYTANAGNGTVSSYAIGPSGSLSLVEPRAGTPGGHPIDEAISQNGRFLYVLNTGAGALGINAFAVQPDGSLNLLGTTSGTPASAAGLVAR